MIVVLLDMDRCSRGRGKRNVSDTGVRVLVRLIFHVYDVMDVDGDSLIATSRCECDKG